MNKAILMILDGWGKGKGDTSDAIATAKTPFIDDLYKTHPHAQLRTDGLHVGLPEGQMGNSEVGHLNIGAGRVVFQELVRIGNAIKDGSLEQNDALQEAFAKASKQGRIHLMGLLSDGGVHSSQDHLHALLSMCERSGIEQIFVHAFLDGRDTAPNGGKGYLQKLLSHCERTNAKIATVVGRYFAMDRDKRWERIRKAYDLMVHGKGETSQDVIRTVSDFYDQNISDEFMEPILLDAEGTIKENDVVLCFNFRTDRCREITQALTQQDFPEHGMRTLALHYVTMTEYDPNYANVHVLFRKENIQKTLGEVISENGGRQIRIAETEKYPHVTFFFSGGREEAFEGEERLIIPSPKVATYDLQPEMSAHKIADSICAKMDEGQTDFVCLNFANPDMVGHTGVFSAIVKAVEKTDSCAKQVAECAVQNGYEVLIIADHGNADMAVNPDGSPHTAHTTNPVPVILMSEKQFELKDGKLADVAPTLLELMQIEQPVEMTGVSLLGRDS